MYIDVLENALFVHSYVHFATYVQTKHNKTSKLEMKIL